MKSGHRTTPVTWPNLPKSSQTSRLKTKRSWLRSFSEESRGVASDPVFSPAATLRNPTGDSARAISCYETSFVRPSAAICVLRPIAHVRPRAARAASLDALANRRALAPSWANVGRQEAAERRGFMTRDTDHPDRLVSLALVEG